MEDECGCLLFLKLLRAGYRPEIARRILRVYGVKEAEAHEG